MDVYLNLCSEYKDKQLKRNIGLINESIANNGLFQKEISNTVEGHLKEINGLLQSVKTRDQGFQLLLPLLQQGCHDLIEKRCEVWYGVCIQAVTSLCGASEKIHACRIIVLLLHSASNHPEIQKILVPKSPASLIQSLAKADSSWNFAALDCLYEFIKLFPGPSLSQKVAIEENMLKYLDQPLSNVNQDDIVKRAGQVYAALPLPGMGGNKALGKAEARGSQLTQLIALAHTTMDLLLDGVVEKELYKHTRECTLKIPSIDVQSHTGADAIRGFLKAVTRLGNTLKFISHFLTSDSNESILLVPYHILGPIFRLLQVDASVLKVYRSQEHQMLAFLISSLHQHCLLVLRDLILSIGEGIDLYFGVITNLLSAVVKNSLNDNEPAWCGAGVQTRTIAYSVLRNVVQTSRGRHSISSELMQLILEDIIPKGQHVTLQKVQRKGLANLTVKKKKKKKGYSVVQTTLSHQEGPMFQLELLSRLTRAALSLSETLYVYGSHSLTQKMKKMLQTNILSLAEVVACGAKLPEAYSDGRTREQLYKTLASIATHPDPRCSPPYTMILHLLQLGLQDQQLSVVATCQALIGSVSFILANPQISQMAVICQPSMPSDGEGHHPMNETSETNSLANHGNEGHGDKEMDDEGEVSEETEDEVSEQTDKMTQENHVQEGKEYQSSEDDSDSELVNGAEEESDVDSDHEDGSDLEKNAGRDKSTQEHVETLKVNGISDNKLPETNCEDKQLPRKDKQPTTKRKSEELPNSRKSVKKNNNKQHEGPSLEEMLSSFIDADPDDE